MMDPNRSAWDDEHEAEAFDNSRRTAQGRTLIAISLTALFASEISGFVLTTSPLGTNSASRVLAVVVFAICAIRLVQGVWTARWSLSIACSGFAIYSALQICWGPTGTSPSWWISVAQIVVRIAVALTLILPSVGVFVESRRGARSGAQRAE